MAAILLIAHAPLATALQAVARHAFPDCGASLEALDVDAAARPEDVEADVRRALARMDATEVLILTDVFGATPCNVAQRLADNRRVRVVTGVNVPMLWRTLCYANETVDALAVRAVTGATQGVMQASASPSDASGATPA